MCPENTEREVDDDIINYPLKILKNNQSLDDFGIPIAGLSQLGVTGDQVLLLIFIFPYPFPACAWDSDQECVPILPLEHQNIIMSDFSNFPR